MSLIKNKLKQPEYKLFCDIAFADNPLKMPIYVYERNIDTNHIVERMLPITKIETYENSMMIEIPGLIFKDVTEHVNVNPMHHTKITRIGHIDCVISTHKIDQNHLNILFS